MASATTATRDQENGTNAFVRRVLGAVALVTLLSAGCGRGEAAPNAAGAALGAGVQVTPTAPAPAPQSPSTIPTTTTAPDPWEVHVAIARPEVEILDTFDAPAGDPIGFEFALTNPTYWGTDLALLVTEGEPGDAWLQVQLPVRPNGSRAWIRSTDVTLSSHRFHAEVHLSERRVRVWDADELVADTQAVIGKPSTPTPIGRFYVNDLLPRDDPGGAYGPWILSLSAFSEALDTFNGGLPVIAIHGTNRPGLLGQDRSNGCIRVSNDIIELLAGEVPLGTPVDIYA